MKMASSLLNKIQVYHRPDLWYGKYDHCVKIWLHEAPCLRDISKGRDRIQKIIQRRKDWGRRLVAASGGKQPGSWMWTNLDITDQDENNLISMLDFLISVQSDFRKVVSGDWMYFYSNDPGFIDSIADLPFLPRPECTKRGQIKLQGTAGSVVLRETRHRYRTYFRGYMRLADQQAENLQIYLAQMPGIRLSPSLSEWCSNHKKYYIGDYFFIDHDDMGIVTMLSLIVPRIIRLTKPIETAK